MTEISADLHVLAILFDQKAEAANREAELADEELAVGRFVGRCEAFATAAAHLRGLIKTWETPK